MSHWLYEPNALLQGIPDYPDMATFADALAFDPSEGLDVSTLSAMQLNDLLNMRISTFEPTTQTMRIHSTMLGMLRGGLHPRNPARAGARARYWELINSGGRSAVVRPELVPGNFNVLLIKGETGTGKSMVIKRFQALLPEVIRHRNTPSIGWHAVDQLVYIKIPISPGGTRGGLITATLQEMDRILGTQYATDIPKKNHAIDSQTMATVARLGAHYTGMLIMEEAQLKNMVASGQSDIMELFFITVVNCEIPLVIVGNSKAFDWIELSQNLRRVFSSPAEYLRPIGSLGDTEEDDEAWDNVFYGISRWYFLPDPIRDYNACSRTLRFRSGGIPGLAATIWEITHKDAHMRGLRSFGPEHIESAYQSQDFAPLRDLARGFAEKDPLLLVKFPDIPAQEYGKVWGKWPLSADTPVSSAASDAKAPAPTHKSKSSPRSADSKLKAQITREATADAQRKKVLESATEDDLRKAGITTVHMAGLDELRAEMEKSKPDSDPKTSGS